MPDKVVLAPPVLLFKYLQNLSPSDKANELRYRSQSLYVLTIALRVVRDKKEKKKEKLFRLFSSHDFSLGDEKAEREN